MLPTILEQIQSVRDEITTIAKSLLVANRLLLDGIKDCDINNFQQAKLELKQISTNIDKVDNNIVKTLALHTPGTQNLRQLVSYLKITNDLLRAAYSTESFINKFTTVCDNLDIAIINEYATPMHLATIKALELTMSMFDTEDIDEIHELYDAIVIEENKSDDIYALVEQDLISQAQNSEDTLKYHQMLRALRKSAKIASRCVSIANLLVYAKVGGELHN